MEVTLPKKTSAKLTAVGLPSDELDAPLVDDATLARRRRYAPLEALADQIQDYRRQRQRWIKAHLPQNPPAAPPYFPALAMR